MNFKKIICLMLVLMMALSVLMACRNVDETPGDESQPITETEESETESKPNDEDTLGE